MRMARILGGIGRALITAGVLILLFVGYQLWGTGIHEARAQNRLSDDFETRLVEFQADNPVVADDSSDENGSDGPDATPATFPAPPPPEDGDGVANLRIPDIGVEKTVVEGVRVADLKKGPGHYPQTPMPGQPGNAAIAGHRTTYGAPFHRVDELEPGDEIIVTTLQGEFRYEVMGHETGEVDENGEPVERGHLIVSPRQVELLEDFGDNRLTLTSCHPKYSARQRIIVIARLKAEPAPAPTTTTTSATGEDTDDADDPSPEPEPVAATADLELDGEDASAWPALWWGAFAAAIWIAAWAVGRRWRKWPSYLIGSPFFFVVLFVFFENFSRLLPANY